MRPMQKIHVRRIKRILRWRYHRGNIRSLGVLAAAPHDDVGRGSLCAQALLVALVALQQPLAETKGSADHAGQVAPSV